MTEMVHIMVIWWVINLIAVLFLIYVLHKYLQLKRNLRNTGSKIMASLQNIVPSGSIESVHRVVKREIDELLKS